MNLVLVIINALGNTFREGASQRKLTVRSEDPLKLMIIQNDTQRDCVHTLPLDYYQNFNIYMLNETYIM